MTRAYLLVSVFLLISIKTLGQCSNSPTVTLSSNSGFACGTTAITVAGNTFGGSATRVTITKNGSGSVSPTSSTSSPFSFTYTPKTGDAGKNITITVTTNNPLGVPCAAATATFILSVSAIPGAPSVGAITQPTCVLPTGSVVLNGLPSSGTWMVTRTPGAVTNTGTGTSTTISGIPSGTFTFKVTNSGQCTSAASSNVVISAQPASPASPAQTIDCALGSGKAGVTVTSPLGTGLQYRLDAGNYQAGTSFINVADGNHTISVRNSSGCITTGSIFQVSCGCSNPPTITLSSKSGTVCGKTSLKVSGNTFGGSATSVTITTNGTGTVNPVSTSSRPFDFTYTPSDGDLGNTVTITLTTDNPSGSPCIPASDTYMLTTTLSPPAPLVGVITQPTCSSSTGSVVLNGLPATGSWTLTRAPGGVQTTGSGNSIIISDLATGTYTYTVTTSTVCTSAASANVVINPQPAIPAAPVVGTITSPTCLVPTGSVVISGLPATDTWTLTRYPGAFTTSGTGTSITISDLPGGLYNYSLTTAAGCTSALSANVLIPVLPGAPSPPLIGTITQPTNDIPTGSVELDGLPATGTWTLTLTPGNITTTGSGTTKTISGLVIGTYSLTVTNSNDCTSGPSASFEISNSTGAPTIVITNPAPVCFPSTVDLTGATIVAGSTLNLTYTFWTNSTATIPFITPKAAPEGIYYIKGTTTDGLFSIKPVTVTVYKPPVANAGPDQFLANKFESSLNASLVNTKESGIWSLVSGTAFFADASLPNTAVNGLSLGKNRLLWTVSNGVCPAVSDTIMITVSDLLIPTLITPNMDGINDYFVIKKSGEQSRMELLIFDRRGVQVYKNLNYDNSWNGVDINKKPLQDDTYFFVLKIEHGISATGFVVVRR